MKHLLFSLLVLGLAFEVSGASPKQAAPPLSVAAVTEVYDQDQNFEGILLVEGPNGMALPGGSISRGESVEQAIRTRATEQATDLELYELEQFHVYSDPKRDQAITLIFLAKAYGRPEGASVVKIDAIPWNELAFDNSRILGDYLTYKKGNQALKMTKP